MGELIQKNPYKGIRIQFWGVMLALKSVGVD